MKIAITGSSGLIGSALVRRLDEAGHDVRPLVRRPARTDTEISWDPAAGAIDGAALEGLDAVVHLAGAGIADERWTDARKQEILTSRTEGTSLLARALADLEDPPGVLISGSAIGFYGDRGDEELTESSPAGSGFLAEVCVAWEAAADAAREAGIRVAHARTGLVLDADGGALAKQLPLFKLGLGGRLGRGTQWWSWISLTDELRALEFLLEADLAGPVNLTAPTPETNARFTEVLGDVLGRPTLLPVPRFGPKLLLGSELAEELLYTSSRVLPRALLDAGFSFTHPDLASALRSQLD